MKKSLFYVFAGALCILGACNKEIEKPEENHESSGEKKMITEQVSVKSENDGSETKVSIDGSNYYHWTINDYMGFFVTDDDGASFVKETSSAYDTGTGKFTLSYEEGYTRGGYGVIPASFAKSLVGSTLTVTYPDSYDISDDIAAGRYDNRGTYIPVPMVAVNSGDNMTFYSIGALVKVTMSNIPAGTKTLYVTFNQTVTGDFTVTNPGTATPTVEVADAENKTTVAITVSEDGLTAAQAANPIVLYIPVPTTTGLGIASSATTKATVSRNKGYAWAVNAITCTGDGSFTTNLGKYFVAPGNLLVSKSGGALSYSFEAPLESKMRNGNPHTNGSSYAPDLTQDLTGLANGEYQDVFTWPQICTILSNGVVPDKEMVRVVPTDVYHFPIVTPLNIGGNDWTLTSTELMYALLGMTSTSYRFPDSYLRTGSKAIVGLNTEAIQARAIVTVADTPYASYSTVSGEIPGVLLFPDNYVDQTDAIQYVNQASIDKYWDTAASRAYSTINLSAFEKMINAGAVFLPAVGYYTGDSGTWTMTCSEYMNESVRIINDIAYYSTDDDAVYFSGSNMGKFGYAAAAVRLDNYASCVRLVREVVAEGTGTGLSFKWDE